MSVCSVPESPDQHHCRHCGEIIHPGDRRPRQFCSDACRQADYRSRQERVAAEKATDRPSRRFKRAYDQFAKIGRKISQRIQRPFVTKFGSLGPAQPVRPRFSLASCDPDGHAARIAAAVDAELGTGTEWLTSPGGARYQVIPSRHAR